MSEYLIEKILVVRCSKCGRMLGYYRGEEFWISGVDPFKAKVLCNKCKKER